MIVYVITNKINNKQYVGITTRTLAIRWYKHRVENVKLSTTTKLGRAFQKYGVDSFEISVLEECSSQEELNLAEVKWITNLDTFHNGYNSTVGGEGTSGWHHSDETKRRISEAHIKLWSGVDSEEKKRIQSEKSKAGMTHPRYGMWNGNAKLTDDDVKSILIELELISAAGGKSSKRKTTRKRIAEKYGVSLATIKKIRSRDYWKHVV